MDGFVSEDNNFVSGTMEKGEAMEKLREDCIARAVSQDDLGMLDGSDQDSRPWSSNNAVE